MASQCISPFALFLPLLPNILGFEKAFYFVLEYSQLTNVVILLVSGEQRRDSAIHIYIHSLSNSLPIQAVT